MVSNVNRNCQQELPAGVIPFDELTGAQIAAHGARLGTKFRELVEAPVLMGDGEAGEPTPLPVRAANIPECLRDRAQWVCWRYTWSGKKWTKPPYQANGRNASPTNPETWTDFATALAAYESGGFAGIGYVLAEGDGLAGIDLDHVLDAAGEIVNPDAAAIIEQFRGVAYIERSPGGDGLRLFVLGTCRHRGKGPANKGLQWIEAYDHTSPRYLTMTGQRLGMGRESPGEGQDALNWLHEHYMAREDVARQDAPQRQDMPQADDDEVIRRASNAEKGAEFRALFEDGAALDYETRNEITDASTLDARLVERLAFYCNDDPEQIDRIFRRSALMRGKWDSRRGDTTYGRMTINRIIQERRSRGASTIGDWDAEHKGDSERIQIKLVAGKRHQAVDEIQKVLGNSAVYQVDGSLYGLTTVGSALEPSRRLTHTTLGTYLARYADLQKYTQKQGWIPAELPADLARAVVDEHHYPDIPKLVGIARQPFIRPDGSLCNTPGYDEVSAMFCAFDGGAFGNIPARPTRADAAAALDRIRGLFEEVEFEGERDRAAAIAACLTAASRRSLPAAPAFLHTSHLDGSGSGKNYSEGMVERFATGGMASPLAYKPLRAELDKSLIAALMKFPDVVRFDELGVGSALAGSAVLLNMLTEPFVSDRILGVSQTTTVPTNVLIQMSGNAITVEGDMRRRTVEIFYAPSGRGQFTKNPLADLNEHRGEFVADALTIITAWLQTERPMSREPIKNYSQWDRWCCQPLIWLGMADPAASMLGNMSSTDGSTVDSEAVADFVEALRKTFGTQWFTAKDVLDKSRVGISGEIGLASAVRTVLGDNEMGPTDATKIGRALARIRSMPVNGWQVQKKSHTGSKAAAKWRVRETPQKRDD